MGDKSSIEWTDATWNPIVGCTIVSPGCTNCYAMSQAARIERMTKGGTHYKGTTRIVKDIPVWTGLVQQAPDHIWTAPLKWKKPRRIFVNSMGDLFHESVPDAWIDKVMAVAALTPHHTYQFLTKRSKRLRDYMSKGAVENVYAEACRHDQTLTDRWKWPLPNVWHGISAEDQTRADERIPDLLATPAAVRFISFEPLLGDVFIENWLATGAFHWAIAGGESGAQARPMHPDWARAIRDHCAAAGVAFFFKQWGNFVPGHYSQSRHTALLDPSDGAGCGLVLGPPPHSQQSVKDWGDGYISVRVGKSRAGRLLDGITHNAMPEVN